MNQQMLVTHVYQYKNQSNVATDDETSKLI